MKKKTLSLISVAAVLALGAGIMVVLTSFKAETVMAEEEVNVRTVKTAPLLPSAQTVWIEADGFLSARRRLDLTVPVSGKIAYAREGLKGGIAVGEGDLLLSLDDRRARLAFESARMEMTQRVNQFLSVAGLDGEDRAEWDRYLLLLDRASPGNLPVLPEGDQRLRLLAGTKGVTQSAYALESAALDLNDHFLSAPFTGVLTGDGITEGSWISPGIPLAGLVETGALELALSLPEGDLLHVAAGDEVLVTRPEDGKILSGIVDRVEPLLNAGSQTARVHIALTVPEGENWLPGSFVSARIGGERFESACRIPREVLIGERLPLFEEGKLALRRVDILAYDGEDVIVACNFSNDAEFVTTVLQNAMEGMLLAREES